MRWAEAEPDAAPPADDVPASLLVEYVGDERGQAELLRALLAGELIVTRFAEQASDLEDIFMQVTKGATQ